MSGYESEVVRLLDRLRRDDLQAMSDKELRAFLGLLEHWRQLAEVERDRRRE